MKNTHMQKVGVWAPVLIQLLGCAAPSPEDELGVGYLCLGSSAKFDNNNDRNTEEEGATEAPLSAPGDDMALHAAKDQFDHIPPWRFKRARAATNPWERLGSGPFVNRSAMKLVNMDAALGLIDRAQECVSVAATASSEDTTSLHSALADAMVAPFSDEEEGGVTAGWSSQLNFVDLCGAPGGFSEYLLWRGAQRVEPTRGFGISLGCDNGEGAPCAWKIEKQSSTRVDGRDSGNSNSFEVCWGADGTGDLYSRLNVKHFVAHVLAATGTASDQDDGNSSISSSSSGVALAVADGGFAAARDSHDQEALMTRLVAAECLCALGCLALGGTFVVKMFETRTDATLDLVTHLALSFHRVALIKPVTSRPASSERYLLCEGLLLHRGSAAMKEVLAHLWALHAGSTPFSNEKAAQGKTEPEPETSVMAAEAATVDGKSVQLTGASSNLMDYPTARRHTAKFLRAANARLGASQLAACEAILAHANGHNLGYATKRNASIPTWWSSSLLSSLPSTFGSSSSQSSGSHGRGSCHPSTHVHEGDTARSLCVDGVQVPQAKASTSTQADVHSCHVTALAPGHSEEATTPLPEDHAQTRSSSSCRCLSYAWFRLQAKNRSTQEHMQWGGGGISSDGDRADNQSVTASSLEQSALQEVAAESPRVNNAAKKRKRARKNKKRAQQRRTREGADLQQIQLSGNESGAE